MGDGDDRAEYTLMSVARLRVAVAGMGLGAVLVLFGTAVDPEMRRDAPANLVLVTAVAALLAWIRVRRTTVAVLDDTGVTLRSPGRRRTLRWDELVEVESRQSRHGPEHRAPWPSATPARRRRRWAPSSSWRCSACHRPGR